MRIKYCIYCINKIGYHHPFSCDMNPIMFYNRVCWKEGSKWEKCERKEDEWYKKCNIHIMKKVNGKECIRLQYVRVYEILWTLRKEEREKEEPKCERAEKKRNVVRTTVWYRANPSDLTPRKVSDWERQREKQGGREGEDTVKECKRCEGNLVEYLL